MMIAEAAKISVGSMTTPGVRRTLNEDALLASRPVYVVADGMGGHAAGDRASAIVIKELGRFLGCEAVAVDEVKQAFRSAREQIAAIESHSADARAGTTISGVVLTALNDTPYWLVVNLGDSRTYRMSRGVLEQLSVDHSEVQELLDRGDIDETMARTHPRRNVVTRALGAGTADEPDFWLLPVEAGDRIMVCSDGLTSEVENAEIGRILRLHADPARAVEALVGAAMAAGGRDNISVIVLDASVPGEALVTAGEPETGDDTVPTNSGTR